MGKIFDSVRIYGTGTTTSATLQTFNGVGTNTFVVRDDGNVGIGTSTPSAKLHLYGTTPFISENTTDGTSTGLIIRSSDSGFDNGQELRLDFQQQTSSIGKIASTFFGGQEFGFKFYGLNNSGFLNDLITFRGSGNVGIGTSTPDSKLVIKGNDFSSSSYSLKIQDSGGTSNFIVSNFGSVGVGNTSLTNGLMALRGLHIQNNTSSYLSIVNTNTSKGIMFGVEDGNFNYQLVSGGGYLYYGDSPNGSSVYTKYDTSNGNWLFSSKNLGNIANTFTRNTDAKVTIVGYGTDSSGNALVVNNVTTGVTNTESPLLVVRNNGNVGIGTSSPSTNFQVNQSSVGIGLISATGVTTSIWPYSYTGYTLVTGVGTLFSDTLKEGDTIQSTGITLTVVYIASQTSLYCVSNPSAVFGTYVGQNPLPYTITSGQRFNVNGKGNIGIGTTTPSSIIDIVHGDRGNYPTMRVRTTNPESGSLTPLQLNTTNYGNASIVLGNSTSTPGSSMTIQGWNSTLHVNGGGSNPGYYSNIALSNNQGTTQWSNYRNTGSGWAGMTFISYAGFGIRTANSDTRGPGMVIDANNNTVFNYHLPINSGFEVFGMGSNTHIARFSQSAIPLGTVNTSQGTGIYSAYTMVTTSDSYFTRLLNVGEIIVAYSANTSPPMYITVNEIVNDGLIYGTHNPSFNYFLGTGSTYGLQGNPRVSIKNNGNVGIGVDSPTEKLDVNGKTKTINLQVTSGATPGYVLTSDASGNATWQQPTGTQDSTTLGTGLTIHFSGKTIFNLPSSPASGNISGDTTNAKLGMIQKIYHQSAVEPTFPATWKLVGEGVYFTNELNIIYAEYVEPTWIEYWIIQQQ